jgi:hypothetical protein
MLSFVLICNVYKSCGQQVTYFFNYLQDAPKFVEQRKQYVVKYIVIKYQVKLFKKIYLFLYKIWTSKYFKTFHLSQ